jgi:large subunit ribosomal protein L35
MSHKKRPKLKIKTNKAAKKRFKVTATGKVLYWPAGKRHLASSKNAKKRRQMRKWRLLTGHHDIKKMHIIMGTGGDHSHDTPKTAAAVADGRPEAKKG